MITDPARIAQRVTEWVRELPEIESAYLFGTVVTGDFDRDSDVDVLLTVNQPTMPAKAQYTEQLAQQLGRMVDLHLGRALSDGRVDYLEAEGLAGPVILYAPCLVLWGLDVTVPRPETREFRVQRALAKLSKVRARTGPDIFDQLVHDGEWCMVLRSFYTQLTCLQALQAEGAVGRVPSLSALMDLKSKYGRRLPLRETALRALVGRAGEEINQLCAGMGM